MRWICAICRRSFDADPEVRSPRLPFPLPVLCGSRIWMAFDTLEGLETGFFFRVGNINECDFFRNEKLQNVVIGVPDGMDCLPAHLVLYFIRDCEEDQHDMLREDFLGGLPINGSVYIQYTNMRNYIAMHSEADYDTCTFHILFAVIRKHFQNESGAAQIVNKPRGTASYPDRASDAEISEKYIEKE